MNNSTTVKYALIDLALINICPNLLFNESEIRELKLCQVKNYREQMSFVNSEYIRLFIWT